MTNFHDRTPGPAQPTLAEQFGAWATERFTPADETPEARDLAAYLNSSRTN
ncbi:hypothetical protein [Kocuria rosea]|uniref:hypothetical protein n=1 Tax=Kocuria rosea TaxID=1275 RepID=UPI000E0768A9|nr:hypothetical protein [Kocuria rosea]STX02586.1 Uncharacterised protein [Kocuria rosea]